MIIVGDIGNTETKICLINSKNIIIKRVTLLTKKINHSSLNKSLLGLNLKNKSINKCLFCSVVPKKFNAVKIFFKKVYKIKCHELKKLNLNKLIKIKVNYKQIGSDRLANAIGIINNKDNFIILDFGTATTFDVLIKNTYHGGVIAPGVKLSLNTLINWLTVCIFILSSFRVVFIHFVKHFFIAFPLPCFHCVLKYIEVSIYIFPVIS